VFIKSPYSIETGSCGFETGPRLEPVIARLLVWQSEIASQKAPTPAAEAERIGLLNRIDTAIQLLKRCDEFNISPGAYWDAVPDLISPSHMPEVRVVDDCESDNPMRWTELAFRPGVAFRLPAGSVVIGGIRTSQVTRLQTKEVWAEDNPSDE
jgi:hypothetical protein